MASRGVGGDEDDSASETADADGGRSERDSASTSDNDDNDDGFDDAPLIISLSTSTSSSASQQPAPTAPPLIPLVAAAAAAPTTLAPSSSRQPSLSPSPTLGSPSPSTSNSNYNSSSKHASSSKGIPLRSFPRKALARPAGAALLSAQGKKIPPGGLAKKSLAKKKAKEAALGAGSAASANFEVLIQTDPLAPLLLSHLSSPFAPPVPLRPLSILRTSTFVSLLYRVPDRGVVSVRVGGRVLEKGVGAGKSGGAGRGLVVAVEGEHWVGC
ncbi:hypothetical protein RQP46_010686 [Phenoliferia psychrophenolica]